MLAACVASIALWLIFFGDSLRHRVVGVAVVPVGIMWARTAVRHGLVLDAAGVPVHGESTRRIAWSDLKWFQQDWLGIVAVLRRGERVRVKKYGYRVRRQAAAEFCGRLEEYRRRYQASGPS